MTKKSIQDSTLVKEEFTLEIWKQTGCEFYVLTV